MIFLRIGPVTDPQFFYILLFLRRFKIIVDTTTYLCYYVIGKK